MITDTELLQLETNGFLIKESVFSRFITSPFLSQIDADLSGKLGKRKGGVRFPQKHSQAIQNLVNCEQISHIISSVIGDQARLVRSVLFDKNQDANWLIPWHQDCTIAVKEQIDTEGFGPWSIKDNIVHTKPPQHILAAMITLRIHLDDCDVDNGALKVVSGSHKLGKLEKEKIFALAKESNPVICNIKQGGIQLMKPLLIHSSSQSKNANHRRVLHLDYAPTELPNGLEWYDHC